MQLKRQPLVPLKGAAAVIGVMLVCVAPLAVLASENYATLAIEVHLTVFAWNAPVLPLGVVVLFSCLLGALLLYSVSVLSALRDRRALKKLRRRVVELEQAGAGSVGSAVLCSLAAGTSVNQPSNPAPPSASRGAARPGEPGGLQRGL